MGKSVSKNSAFIKEMFKVQDKYAKTNDFVRKVIEPAKNELDELSPYTFETKYSQGSHFGQQALSVCRIKLELFQSDSGSV